MLILFDYRLAWRLDEASARSSVATTGDDTLGASREPHTESGAISRWRHSALQKSWLGRGSAGRDDYTLGELVKR